MADFARTLIQLRENHNISQKALSSVLGVTPSVVSQYEHGCAMPGYDVLLKIADYFHVSTDFLFGRDAQALETEGRLNAIFVDNLTNRQLLEQCAGLTQEHRKILCGLLQILSKDNKL